MGARSRRVVMLAMASLLAGCSVILGFEELKGANVGPTNAAGEAGEAAVGDASIDVIADVEAPAFDDAGCPTGRGPMMVRGGDAFCIDSTEVTAGQYMTFLNALSALDGGIGAGPSACSWKTDHVPAAWPRTTDKLDYPVTWVDWCDAEAFCRWSGKRLCGVIGTGATLVGTAQALSAATSEWFAACTGGGRSPYPYGSTFVEGACNLEAGPAVASVRSFEQCEGGVPGLFDMLGNVWEWANWCDADAGPNDACRDFGSAANSLKTVTCSNTGSGSRQGRNGATGFRCCSSVVQ